MNKFITLSLLATFWDNIKTYITNALAGKADATHSHDYAASAHGHTQTDITGLSDALAGKANADHSHNYAAATHSHAYADLTGKPTIPTTVAQMTDAGNYALKTELPTITIATEAEINALFA